MRQIVLEHQTDFTGWRSAARRLVAAGIAPARIDWTVGEAGLFGAAELPDVDTSRLTVPREFVDLAEKVIQANDPERFAILYSLLWSIHTDERHLLRIATDPLVYRTRMLAKSVSRDTHKMRAFLRFREVTDDQGTMHVAWFEPEHYIVEANAGFFQRRFASMPWIILTPYRSLRWDGKTLFTAPGADKSMLPEDDAMRDYWNIYFASIFNPARLKVKAMTSEMPRKYWRNMPEAAQIPALIRNAGQRTAAMIGANQDMEFNERIFRDRK